MKTLPPHEWILPLCALIIFMLLLLANINSSKRRPSGAPQPEALMHASAGNTSIFLRFHLHQHRHEQPMKVRVISRIDLRHRSYQLNSSDGKVLHYGQLPEPGNDRNSFAGFSFSYDIDLGLLKRDQFYALIIGSPDNPDTIANIHLNSLLDSEPEAPAMANTTQPQILMNFLARASR